MYNAFLEFPNSSLYQSNLLYKDIIENYRYSFFDKYINKDYINKQGKGCKIKSIKKKLEKGLLFEKELTKFYNIYKEINSCDDYKDILESINNYDFEKLDIYYEKVNKNSINDIIYLILWANRIFKNYCMYILNFINIFEEDITGKNYLEEFINEYYNYVCSFDFINGKFLNVNIIINYLISFILKKKDSRFSLEELAMKIFKKTVYDNISEKIINKTSLLYNRILTNILENKIDIERKEVNYTLIEDDITAEYLELNRENTEKEILDNLLICIVDFSMNKKNITDIKRSYIKLDDSYEICENNLIKRTEEIIEQELFKGMTISAIFEKFKILLENKGNPTHNVIESSNSFIFINKTKKNMLNSVFHLLYKKLLHQLNQDINSRIKLHMEGRTISISNLEEINNKKFSYDSSDFSENQRMKIENKVQDELNKIKSFLYEQNSKGYETLETNKLVNEYIENNGIQLVLLMKKMIYFYYKEYEYYDEKDQKLF